MMSLDCGFVSGHAYALVSDHAYELVGAENWGRIDIIDDGIDYFLLELNSVPGMTETSLVPKSSHLSGISYLELLESIMDDAIAKKA